MLKSHYRKASEYKTIGVRFGRQARDCLDKALANTRRM